LDRTLAVEAGPTNPRWIDAVNAMLAEKAFPVFAVADLDQALAYYRERLGFTVAWLWGTPPVRAGVVFDSIEIQLDASGSGSPDGTSLVYIHMQGVDTYYRQCRERGATILLELGERPWGMSDFRVADPSGNRLGFASVAASAAQHGIGADRER
jgi:uncharacterized glyoxalase superfamily protein PhnB